MGAPHFRAPDNFRMPHSIPEILVTIPVLFMFGLWIGIALYCFFPKMMLRLGYLQYDLYCWIRNQIYAACIKATMSWWQFKAALNKALEVPI